MDSVRASSSSLFHYHLISRSPSSRIMFGRAAVHFPSSTPQTILLHSKKDSLKISATTFSAISTPIFDQESETKEKVEKFDWYAHWYPVMPVCELDKRRPHGMKVMGMDIVVWWDRNLKEWKVFEDTCPHRLAPLSEGRIDQWGRLQCVYHGWCFSGYGDCKFIPQSPREGPPIHSSRKACVAVHPSYVQNEILWFWPMAGHQYKDIISIQKPPYIAELNDPSFTSFIFVRDIPYGYEFLLENLMDTSHVLYAHHGIIRFPKPPNSMADREGGVPLEINVKEFGINGFNAKSENNDERFIPPCLFYRYVQLGNNSANSSSPSTGGTKKASEFEAWKGFMLVGLCVPVSPGKSRLIFAQPRNVALWVDQVVPRWILHAKYNTVVDSDLRLLHLQERKIKETGTSNWHKTCFNPTKADAIVVAFRRWLNKYSGGQVDWGTMSLGDLPPTPPREQLMDRYLSHTISCNSCNLAYKALNGLQFMLQVISIASLGIIACSKHDTLSSPATKALAATAVIGHLASEWLARYVYSTFHYHDYDHTFC